MVVHIYKDSYSKSVRVTRTRTQTQSAKRHVHTKHKYRYKHFHIRPFIVIVLKKVLVCCASVQPDNNDLPNAYIGLTENSLQAHSYQSVHSLKNSKKKFVTSLFEVYSI